MELTSESWQRRYTGFCFLMCYGVFSIMKEESDVPYLSHFIVVNVILISFNLKKNYLSWVDSYIFQYRTVQEVIVSRKTSRRLLECFALHEHFVFMIITPQNKSPEMAAILNVAS